MKNSLIIAGAATSVGLSGLIGISAVSASSNNGNMTDLVSKVASKFNLNKSDVQKVFDEDHATREAAQAQKQSDRLQKLVDAGTISAPQKIAIEAKLKELGADREANRGDMKNLSETDRKAKIEKERTDLEAWAKAQGLDFSKLRGIMMGRGFGHGPGGPGMHRGNM